MPASSCPQTRTLSVIWESSVSARTLACCCWAALSWDVVRSSSDQLLGIRQTGRRSFYICSHFFGTFYLLPTFSQSVRKSTAWILNIEELEKETSAGMGVQEGVCVHEQPIKQSL